MHPLTHLNRQTVKQQKARVNMHTQIRISNIMHLNRGGVTLALHNKLARAAGRCTQIAHRVATTDWQIILN